MEHGSVVGNIKREKKISTLPGGVFRMEIDFYGELALPKLLFVVDRSLICVSVTRYVASSFSFSKQENTGGWFLYHVDELCKS